MFDIIVGPNSLGSYLGVLRAIFSRCVSHGLSEYGRNHKKQERYDYGSHRTSSFSSLRFGPLRYAGKVPIGFVDSKT